MALSPEMRERAKQMLNDMSASKRAATLATEGAFRSWLQRTAYWIYNALGGIVTPLYHVVRFFFS